LQERVVGDRHLVAVNFGERLVALERVGDGRVAAAAVVAGDDEAEDDEDGERDDDDAARPLQPTEKLEHDRIPSLYYLFRVFTACPDSSTPSAAAALAAARAIGRPRSVSRKPRIVSDTRRAAQTE